MSPEQQKLYEAYHSLFLEDGWTNFIKNISQDLEVITDLNGLTSLEELWYAKGQKVVLENVVNFEVAISNLETAESEGEEYHETH